MSKLSPINQHILPSQFNTIFYNRTFKIENLQIIKISNNKIDTIANDCQYVSLKTWQYATSAAERKSCKSNGLGYISLLQSKNILDGDIDDFNDKTSTVFISEKDSAAYILITANHCFGSQIAYSFSIKLTKPMLKKINDLIESAWPGTSSRN